MSIQNSISLKSSVTKEIIVVMVRNREAMETNQVDMDKAVVIRVMVAISEDQTITKMVVAIRNAKADITMAQETVDSVIVRIIQQQMDVSENEVGDLATVAEHHVSNKFNL